MILISLIIIVSVLVMFTVRRNQRKLIIENFITQTALRPATAP